MRYLDLEKDYNEIAKYSEEVFYSEDSEAAKKLIIFLEDELVDSDLKNKNPHLYSEYQLLIRKAKWVRLGNLPEAEIIELFKNNFTDVFVVNDSYDTWLHVREKLLTELDLDARNAFKAEIRSALMNNGQTFVESADLKKVYEWIREYSKNVGNGVVTSLKQQQFFQSNPAFQKLNKDEKDKVRKLLKFYERLKISSRSLIGLEEEIIIPEEEGRNTYIKEGEIIAPQKDYQLSILNKVLNRKSKINQIIPPAQNSELVKLQELISQYPQNSLERKALEEEIKKLKK